MNPMIPPLPPPLKRLGQNFLVDPNIVRKIVALAAIQSEEPALEIGPGRGALTRDLSQVARHLLAIEIDSQLHAHLRETLADCTNLTLHLGDALAYPFETLERGTVVVANLPYYISTPLLFALLEVRPQIDRMVLMLQTEVARRLVAQPGSEEYGALSVLIQYATEPTLAFRVSKQCFRPRPDVESAVVLLKVRKAQPVPVENEAQFVKVVRAAFAHRRKTLVNSLKDEGWPAEAILQALAATRIDPTRRAETLSLEEFAVLSGAVRQHEG